MTFDGDEPQMEFDEDNNEWVWTAAALGVGAVPFFLIREEIALHQLSMNPMFTNITRDMYAGNLLIPDWQLTVAAELRDAHMANAIFAAGGRSNVTPEMLSRVQGTLEKELSFLSNFAQEIESGIISEAQAVARIQQYSNAIEQSYWNEWVAGAEPSKDWSSLPILPGVPGDGSTTCRGNCQCWLEYTDSGIIWVLSASENCEAGQGTDGCVDRASGGPYRPG